MKDGKTHFADNDTLDYIAKLEEELTKAQAEIARMRPVVEGAREWAANNGEPFSTAGLLKIVDEYESGKPK